MKIDIDPNVDSLVMPENLRVGLMVAKHREKCLKVKCDFDYAAFAFGQSPFPVPKALKDALARHADKGKYSSASGIEELSAAIKGFYKRHFGVDVDASRIRIGPGSKDVIFAIFAFMDCDVIIPSPSWIGYYPILKLLGKKYHTLHMKSEFNYKIDCGQLEDFLRGLNSGKKQHILVLNNPNNPIGSLYLKEELEDIAGVCRKHNTLILSDEIYALSTFNFENFTSMANVYPEGSFVTSGIAKDRSAGGYRLGTCILPEWDSGKLGEAFSKVIATVHTNVCTPIQYAAISAYEPNDEINEYFEVTRNIHRIMGLFMSDEFNKIDGIKATVPQGSFYFYADFNGLKDVLKRKGVLTSNDLGRSLLKHPHHIAVVTGDAIMLSEDDFGARIACVDYDGAKVYEAYKASPPKTKSDEAEFIKANAPKMIIGIEKVKTWVEDIRK